MWTFAPETGLARCEESRPMREFPLSPARSWHGRVGRQRAWVLGGAVFPSPEPSW